MNLPKEIPSPCYVLEENKLRKNLEKIARVQTEAGVEIILAFKGFAMWSVFPIVKEYLGGVTASSYNEVQLAVNEFHEKAHTYCVAYDPNTFDAVAGNSSYLTFNSLDQFLRYEKQIPDGLQVGLRVNPEWSDVSTPLYNPADPKSRLGMTISEMPSTLPKEISGLHFHVLCESSASSLERVLENFTYKFGSFLDKVDWVNMGGGHLMTRSDYDLDLLIEILTKFRKKHDVKVILEPGAAIAWQTGFLCSHVLDIIQNGGTKTAICDISFTCHMPDCLEMPYRPIISGASREPHNTRYKYRIGGVSCLAGDFLEEYGFDNPLQVGDSIIFEDMIHYTMVKSNTFNGVAHPGIGMIKSDGSFKLIKEFGYEDFRDRLS